MRFSERIAEARSGYAERKQTGDGEAGSTISRHSALSVMLNVVKHLKLNALWPEIDFVEPCGVLRSAQNDKRWTLRMTGGKEQNNEKSKTRGALRAAPHTALRCRGMQTAAPVTEPYSRHERRIRTHAGACFVEPIKNETL